MSTPKTEYTRIPMQPHGLQTPTLSMDDEAYEESDDEKEEERKVERWARRKRNTDLILAVLDSNLGEVRRLLGAGVSPLVRCQQSMATACHIAALRGEDEILEALAAAAADGGDGGGGGLRSRDGAGRQPHHLAAAAGHLATLELILRLEPGLVDSQAVLADLKGTVGEDHLDSFLHDHQEVTRLMRPVTLGSTALHIAAKSSFVDMVEFLLEMKAGVNIRDKDGLSPLDVAGVYADPTIPGTIVSAAEPSIFSPASPDSGEPYLGPHTTTDQARTRAADRQAVGDWVEWPENQRPRSGFRLRTPPTGDKRRSAGRRGSTALLPAIANTTVSVVSSLIKGGGMLSSDQGALSRTTPLHRLVEMGDTDSIERLLGGGDGGGIRLAEIQRMIEAKDALGRTPIHLAVEGNLMEPLRLLLSFHTGPVNTGDDEGRTPLHVAVSSGSPAIVGLLLDFGPDLRLRTREGETVLHLAAKAGSSQILESLLEAAPKSVVNQRDSEGYTPLFRAVENGDVQCVEKLLDACRPRRYIPKSNNSLVHVAVRSSLPTSLNVLKVLAKRLNLDYSNYNRQNADGYSPIHLAVEEDSILCLEYLLDTDKIDLRQERGGEEGGTALHLAAAQGRLKALEKILERLEQEGSGGLVTAEDRSGRQPLILAALGGHKDCVVSLLRRGASLAARDSADQAALDLIYYNIPNAARLLDDLFDGFMAITSKEHREDSPSFQVTIDYRCLLADKKKDHRQLGVVEAIIKCRNEGLRRTLFLHPLTESFLRYKWKQLQLFYRILFFVFLCHLAALTGYGLCTHVYAGCLVCGHAWILRCIVWATVVPLFILEMMTFRLDKTYLMDSETWTKWLVMTTSAASVAPLAAGWMRHASSLAVLFAWLQLLFFVAQNHSWGLRVLMFLEVAANVLQVFTTFLFLLLGFAFSFLILFERAHPFETAWATLSKIVVMMVELDYANVYSADGFEGQATAVGVVGRLIYLGFVVLVVMVLNNLIIGMSVSDVAELEAQGRSKRVSKQASFLVLFEKILYQDLLPETAHDFIRRHRSAPHQAKVWPNKKRDHGNPLPGELRARVLRAVMNREEMEEADGVCRKVESLAEDVRELLRTVKEMKDSIKKLKGKEAKLD